MTAASTFPWVSPLESDTWNRTRVLTGYKPSPTERKSFWHGSSASVTSSNHRSMLNENEPFMISRESFDSYRRSFDISARSPVVQPGGPPLRKSLDSRVAGQLQSTASEAGEGQRSSTADEHFEDVGLHDEIKPKKKSLFARFAETDHSNPTATPTSPLPHHGFSFPGRKRGHSGQGAELGKIDRSGTPACKGCRQTTDCAL